MFHLSDIYNLKEIKFQIKTAETTADGFWDFFPFLNPGSNLCLSLPFCALSSFGINHTICNGTQAMCGADTKKNNNAGEFAKNAILYVKLQV